MLRLEPILVLLATLLRLNPLRSHRRRRWFNRFQLTRHDAIALAIAKYREIGLVTGDRRLRAEAERHGVSCMGTIGILDRLAQLKLITLQDQHACWLRLRAENGRVVRLPKHELDTRIAKLETMLGSAS